jgi:hypothetical protein
LNKRAKLRLFLVFILIGFIVAPAFADEQTIELSPEVPYVDVVVEATEPTQITIQTTNGTPQTNPSFIDSWVELWQGATKLFANDDGAHSGTNVLASFISAPIEAGTYFIRATSFGWMASNQTQTPTGSYLLTWHGVTTLQPTPTPTPEASPTETTTQTPSPEPTLTPTTEPTPTETPLPPIEQPVQNEENTTQDLPIVIVEPEEIIPDLPEEEIVRTLIEPTIEEPFVELPVIEELTAEELIEQEQALYVEENTIELQLPTALAEIPGVEQIFAAAEAVMNVGSDMTQEQREESQAVVVSAIILTQIASMTSISVSQSSSRKFNK